MPDVLGIDTSNYTTSAALLKNGIMHQIKKLLPVKKGELGLRQCDAVFHHVRQLPQILENIPFQGTKISAVGVSDRPRSEEGSYMPCFLAGVSAAKAAALCLGVPIFQFSHQQGHIAAVLYSAKKLKLFNHRFLAFHVSGGTTEAVLAEPEPSALFQTSIVAQSLDLKAGQAVDRVGGMLGLPFPAGPELERLARKTDVRFSVKPSLKGSDCSLSGIQNQCHDMLERGRSKEEIASFCLQSLLAAIDGMAGTLQKKYGNLPLVFAGGVMSNTILRAALENKYEAIFAPPEYSSDNAAGIAALAALKEGISL